MLAPSAAAKHFPATGKRTNTAAHAHVPRGR